MKILFKRLKLKNARGDTIVEVMTSLVVLSMVLATIFALSSRALHAGNEATQRTEALAFAQSQIDLLTNAKNSDSNFVASYQTDQAFCMNPDGTKNSSAQASSDKLCHAYGGSQYNIGISYSPRTSQAGVFVITAQWPSANSPNGTANLNLYYKLPGIYQKPYETAGTAKVTGLTASANGTVNPNNNAVTDCYFNYDTTTSYAHAQKVNCFPAPGAGSSPVTVNANFTGLSPNTTYYFQVCATNLAGTACSTNPATFSTQSGP